MSTAKLESKAPIKSDEVIEQVRIFCRVRPPLLSPPQSKDGITGPPLGFTLPPWLKLTDTEAEIVVGEGTNRTERTTKTLFDKVLSLDSTQEDVYRECVSSLVGKVVTGYPAVLLAYGQSGSGKTHTICGATGSNDQQYPKLGVVHMIARDLLSNDRVKQLHVTAVELYNQVFYNASLPVEQRDPLKARINQDRLLLDNVPPRNIRYLEQFNKFFSTVSQNRRTNAQELNDRSTRSHLIITFQVTAIADSDTVRCETIAELKVIDLCGSERVKRSGATADVFTETVNINTNLFELGKSISELVDFQAKGVGFISTRNDNLTACISQALRGESLFSFIFHIRADSKDNREETYDTLKFAARCKCIKTTAHAQKLLSYEQLAESLRLSEELEVELYKEIESLKAKLKLKPGIKYVDQSTQTETVNDPPIQSSLPSPSQLPAYLPPPPAQSVFPKTPPPPPPSTPPPPLSSVARAPRSLPSAVQDSRSSPSATQISPSRSPGPALHPPSRTRVTFADSVSDGTKSTRQLPIVSELGPTQAVRSGELLADNELDPPDSRDRVASTLPNTANARKEHRRAKSNMAFDPLVPGELLGSGPLVEDGLLGYSPLVEEKLLGSREPTHKGLLVNGPTSSVSVWPRDPSKQSSNGIASSETKSPNGISSPVSKSSSMSSIPESLPNQVSVPTSKSKPFPFIAKGVGKSPLSTVSYPTPSLFSNGLAPGFANPLRGRKSKFNSLPVAISLPSLRTDRRPQLTNPHETDSGLTVAQTEQAFLLADVIAKYTALMNYVQQKESTKDW